MRIRHCSHNHLYIYTILQMYFIHIIYSNSNEITSRLNHIHCVFPSIHSGHSLFWVAMLGLVVLYIYGLVSYAAYQSYFDDPESGSHCRTLFQCVVSVIRLGLIGGGGLVTVSSSCSMLQCIQYVMQLQYVETLRDGIRRCKGHAWFVPFIWTMSRTL